MSTVDFLLAQSGVVAVQAIAVCFGVTIAGLWAYIRALSVRTARELRLARQQLTLISTRLKAREASLRVAVGSASQTLNDATQRFQALRKPAASPPIGEPILVINAVEFKQAKVEPGGKVEIDFVVENIGGRASDAVDVSIRLVDAAGGQVGVPFVQRIQGLESKTSAGPVGATFELPKDVMPGEYHFTLMLPSGVTRHSASFAVAAPAPTVARPPVADQFRKPDIKHQVFISYSRDMHNKAGEICDLVEKFDRSLKPFNYAYADPLLEEINGQHIKVLQNWQDRIGAPHEHGAQLVVVLIGERVGLEMDSDFGRSKRGEIFFDRLVEAKLDKLIHVPGRNDSILNAPGGEAIVPLTGLVYELVETLIDHLLGEDQEHRKLLICINGTRDGTTINHGARLWSEAQIELGRGATDGLDPESWRAQNALQRKWVGILYEKLLGRPQKYCEIVWLKNNNVVLADKIRDALIATFVGEDASIKIDGLPGAAAFEPKHALFFAGREDELEALMNKLRGQKLPRGTVSVVGSSAAGKSSLVSAGLLARLTSVARRSDGYGVAYLDVDALKDDDDPFKKLGAELDLSDERKRRRVGHVLHGTKLQNFGELLGIGDVDGAISVLNLSLAEARPEPQHQLVLIIDHFDTAEFRSQADIASRTRWQQFCHFILSMGATAASAQVNQPTSTATRMMITTVTTSLVAPRQMEGGHVAREKMEVFRDPLVDLIYRKSFSELRLPLGDVDQVIGTLAGQCAELRAREPILPFISIGLRRLHEAMRHGLAERADIDQDVIRLCSPITSIQEEGNAVSKRIDELDEGLGKGAVGLPVGSNTIAMFRNRASHAEVAFRGLMRRVVGLGRQVLTSDPETIEVPIRGRAGPERFSVKFRSVQVKGPQHSVAQPMRDSRFLADKTEQRISLAHRQILLSWERAQNWLHDEARDLELFAQLGEARTAWQRNTQTLIGRLSEIGRETEQEKDEFKISPQLLGAPLQIALWRMCDLFARQQQDMDSEARAFVIECIAHLIENSQDMGKDALLIAASIGDVELVERIAAKAKSLSDLVRESGKETDDNATAAHFAAQYGHKAVLEKFKQGGVNLDARTEGSDFRPIHLAAQNGQLDAFIYLMEHGEVDINAPAKGGVTPMHFASGLGYDDIVAGGLANEHMEANLPSLDGSRPLHLAAQNGHANIVRLLLEKVPDKDVETESGFTALHLAIRSGKEGHFDCVEALLKGGADPHKPFPVPYKRTTLDVALQENKLKIAELLQGYKVVPQPEASELDRTLNAAYGEKLVGGLLERIEPSHLSRIMRQAVEEQRSKLVRALAGAGKSFRPADETGAPLAVVAVRKGDPDLVAAVLDTDCDVGAVDEYEWTALHYAAQSEHPEILRLVAEALSHTAALENRTKEGASAINVAIAHNRPSNVECLARAGAKVDISTLQRVENNSQLFRAVALGTSIGTRSRIVREAVTQKRFGIINALIDAGVSFREVDTSADPILVIAARAGDLGVVEAVLRSDAVRDAADVNGKTALHHAVSNGATNIVRMLIAARAKLDAVTEEGWTPLHLAAQRNDLDIAQTLHDAGARTDIEDQEGRVAADFADGDDDDPTRRALWRLLSPIALGALVRGRVGGTEGREAVHPTIGIFFRFGDGSVGLTRYKEIDPALAGRMDGRVRYSEAKELFQDSAYYNVYVVGRPDIGKPAWDLVVRGVDQGGSVH